MPLLSRSWPLRICDCPVRRVRRVTVLPLVGPGEKGLLHFAFLHSCLMTQPSAASHPGCLLFPTRNCFQVTCLRWFLAALLGLAHLRWPWEHRPVWRADSWEDHPHLTAWGQSWVGKWCCGRHFYLQTRLFHPWANPLEPLSPWGDGRQRMVDWQGLIPNLAVA